MIKLKILESNLRFQNVWREGTVHTAVSQLVDDGVLISECFPRVSLERSVCIYTQTVSLMLNAQGRIVHSPTRVKETPPPQ